jgi:iron complex outermembrane receptor protein
MPLSIGGMPLRRGLLLLAALLPGLAAAQLVAANGGLAELSLEELSELPVTSVSGRPQSLRSAPASVYVITGEDIRRSAATSLPEALRLAPNLQVARLGASQYAISARGFSNGIANKLLVLIDGRTIYSTLFSGVFWDYHDLVLEDIERIEVISGPGGTLWGANAVNGIINVITKSAAATQGTLVTATRSSHGGQEAARWGGRIAPSTYLRLYGLALDRDNTVTQAGAEQPDATSKRQVGFRADHREGGSQLTVQGDAFEGGDAPGNNMAPQMYGATLLARWESRFADGSPYRVQAYYDLQARDETLVFRNRASALDLQFTHEPAMPAGQQLLWGGGYRHGRDSNETTLFVRFEPEERSLSWANLFVQHQLALGRRWQLTSGVKAERNSYTGLEWLPSLRLAYQHGNDASTWIAASRAVRAPARIDREFFFPGNPPFLIAGGAGFESETANVVEIGHRGQAGPDLTYSITGFRQNYQGLRAGRGTPAVVANRIAGFSQGVEAWAQWQPRQNARFSLGYVGMRKKLHFSEGPPDPVSIPNLGNDPQQQWKARAQFDLPHRTELDLFVRHIGTLPSPRVPSYTVADLRLGWQAAPTLELSLIARNVFNREHVEFDGGSEFGRGIFLRAVFQL